MTDPKSGLPLQDHEMQLLLRQAGVREDPGAHLADQVYRATHAAWQELLTERRRRRRTVWGSSVAAAAVAALALTMILRSPVEAPLPQPVASVARVQGQLEVTTPPAQHWLARAAGDTIEVGQVLATGPNDRAALDMSNGLSVRFDHDTRVAMLAAHTLRLDSGALYVDAAPDQYNPLVIEAGQHSIRHQGTQYSVRMQVDGVDIAIREGQVLIDDGTQVHTGQSQEHLHLSRDGHISRTVLMAQDPQWSWATQITPGFDIEGRTLAVFLEWVARETGRRLVYDSEDARTSASQAQLSGSIAELDIDTALMSVLTSTQLRRYDSRDDVLGITLAQAGQDL